MTEIPSKQLRNYHSPVHFRSLGVSKSTFLDIHVEELSPLCNYKAENPV